MPKKTTAKSAPAAKPARQARKSPKHPCPCCGKALPGEPGDFEICPVCNWEDDPVQSKDPDFAGGANELSLNEAKKQFASAKK
jgi:hypothetical protein